MKVTASFEGMGWVGKRLGQQDFLRKRLEGGVVKKGVSATHTSGMLRWTATPVGKRTQTWSCDGMA